MCSQANPHGGNHQCRRIDSAVVPYLTAVLSVALYAECSVCEEREGMTVEMTPFDHITMTLAEKPSRRDLLRLFGVAALGASTLALLGADEAEGKRRRKKRKNKKKGDKCKDRCGGSCPRCGVGTTCDDRDQCTTAFCDGGVCAESEDNAQCGLDTDGVNGCFRRENAERNGEIYCSRQTCRLDGVNSCDDCKGQEICSPQGGNGFECCMPCGA